MATVFSYIVLLFGALFVTLTFYIALVKVKLIQDLGMVELLLSGIVLGLVPVTITGLFVTAYLQYRRGDQLNI